MCVSGCESTYASLRVRAQGAGCGTGGLLDSLGPWEGEGVHVNEGVCIYLDQGCGFGGSYVQVAATAQTGIQEQLLGRLNV